MKYTITVSWEKKTEEPFKDNRYSRAHTWIFDGGVELPVSSSPQVVPVPMSDVSAADPEEAFVGALSSCHMLFFLSIAAAQKFVIESYQDNAEGIMSKNKDGKSAMTKVTLNPRVKFTGEPIPDKAQINKLHEEAHEKCFIANSVKSEIRINPM